MTVTATVEKPTTAEQSRREIQRKCCAYLKGFLVGYASRKGMKWYGDPERTEEFAQGFGDSKRVGSKTITFAHIIYNWIRHDRPHLGAENRDEQFVKEFRRMRGNKLLAALAEYGLDIKEVLK